jgi:hypothetical protein
MTTPKLVKTMERLIRQDSLKLLQFNPYVAASQETGLPPSHSKSRMAARKYFDAQKEQLKAYSAIFGDTYWGMPIDDAITILKEEGFSGPNGMGFYLHSHIGVRALIAGQGEKKLAVIELLCDMTIIPNSMDKNSVVGIGITQGEVIGDSRFIGRIEATGGLRLKMMMLRSFVAAEGVYKIQINADEA